ncbi:DUF305 domain-containing protein [Agromyces aureus]|uniref:DUF305 domain-containing protein n=1 Tax=Agromyces aureus TaxID=453304 RepID=A0A191WBI4_9MICO|nr:DUF305 domain-containing protein [Agromyces aureus]ANJ25558.1 hypothetical protein ATC03_00985 [Agromyces aureus]
MRRPIATTVALAVVLVAGAAMVGPRLAAADAARAAERIDGAPGSTVMSASGRAATSDALMPSEAGVDPTGAVDDLPNDADMLFAMMMIPHHEQAVELSKLLAATPDIDEFSISLAAFIETDQTKEIAAMHAWLEAWHGVGVMNHAGGGTMAGMATPEQIAEFDSLSGAAAEARFLDLMIAHHRGALAMADDAIADGRNSYIRSLAKHIAAEQEREIAAMTLRLDEL